VLTLLVFVRFQRLLLGFGRGGRRQRLHRHRRRRRRDPREKGTMSDSAPGQNDTRNHGSCTVSQFAVLKIVILCCVDRAIKRCGQGSAAKRAHRFLGSPLQAILEIRPLVGLLNLALRRFQQVLRKCCACFCADLQSEVERVWSCSRAQLAHKAWLKT